MNKKILTLLLLLIAISTISIVSATDTQKIGDLEFNVPDGYTYDADSVDVFLKAFDDESDLASQFGIMSIPFVASFKNGEIYKTTIGAQPKEAILELLS